MDELIELGMVVEETQAHWHGTLVEFFIIPTTSP